MPRRNNPKFKPGVTMADLPLDWWEIRHVMLFLGISYSTWTAYRSRGQVPEHDRMFGRTPVWRPGTIRELARVREWETLELDP